MRGAGRPCALGTLSCHPLFGTLWLTASFLQAVRPVHPERTCQGWGWRPSEGRRHTLPSTKPGCSASARPSSPPRCFRLFLSLPTSLPRRRESDLRASLMRSRRLKEAWRGRPRTPPLAQAGRWRHPMAAARSSAGRRRL